MKKFTLVIFLAALLGLSLSSCKQAQDEPWFKLRGIVVAWDDIKNPDQLDWLAKMKETGMNTISVCGFDYLSDEYAQFKQKCIDNGIDFEYEEHAMTWLLPRDLINEHPEYFRMDENGVRRNDANGCPSCEEALEVIRKNAAEFALKYAPSNHRYYTWLFDGGGICHCEKCKNYNASDQGLIYENAILEGIRTVDPEAVLAHLAYESTTPAPSCIKPSEGVFLEWAPFYRRWDEPLSNRAAIRPDQKWSHGDYLDMLEDNLKVFPAETAQVLEYWLDVSQRSGWKKPAKDLGWNEQTKAAFLDDLKTYASYGIRNITCYGVYIDADYLNMYKDVSCITDYGKALRDFRPKK